VRVVFLPVPFFVFYLLCFRTFGPAAGRANWTFLIRYIYLTYLLVLFACPFLPCDEIKGFFDFNLAIEKIAITQKED
jgi:hypothetical protein